MDERPGKLRRAGAGAWHVLAGFGFLIRRPRLWPLAILPALIAVVCLVSGVLLAIYSVGWIENAIFPSGNRLTTVTFLLTITLYIGTIIAGLVLGLAVALLLSAPALEALSSRVDAMVRGGPVDRSRGWKWEMTQAFRGTLYFLVAAPGVFLLTLIPVIGPPLALLWGSYALAFQQTDAALARRGMSFAQRRAWHAFWKPESMGFGLAGLITLVVPFANFLIGPALAVGGTLLVLELEDQLIPPDVTTPAVSPAP